MYSASSKTCIVFTISDKPEESPDGIVKKEPCTGPITGELVADGVTGGVAVAVRLLLALLVPVLVLVGVFDEVRVFVVDGVGVRDADGGRDILALAEAPSDLLLLGVLVSDGDTELDIEMVGVLLGVLLGDAPTDNVAVPVPLGVLEGVLVCVPVLVEVCVGVGVLVLDALALRGEGVGVPP